MVAVDKQSKVAEEFREALIERQIPCVHPTDTIPGLTFDPRSPLAYKRLLTLKGYRDSRPFVGLVASLDLALKMFSLLPNFWLESLPKIWPGPVTLIWKASSEVPSSLVHSDHTVAIRVPNFAEEAYWYRDLLTELACPLPSTSVNTRGVTPLVSYTDLRNFANPEDCFLPASKHLVCGGLAPSAIVRIRDDGGYNVIRGSFDHP